MYSYKYLILIVCCFLCIMRYLKIINSFWKKRNIKEANGVMWRFITGNKCVAEIIKDIYDDHSTQIHVGFMLGANPYLIIRDLDNIQSVLHGKFEYFHSRNLVPKNPNDVLFGNLFLTDDLNKWKLMRHVLSPVLSKTMLRETFYISERCVRDFADYIQGNAYVKSTPFNAIHAYTIASISAKVFGIDDESQSTMMTPYHMLVVQILNPYLKFNMNCAFINTAPCLYKLLNIKIAGIHEKTFIKVIKEAMEKRKKSNKIQNDLIDFCLKLEETGVIKDHTTGFETNVTVEFLAKLIYVFFIGGIETITAALHFTLFELSRNSRVLRKLHDEIDKEIQNNGGTLTFDSIDNLDYLEMVLKESMRKYPPIGVIQRKCYEDTILPVGNIKIEKGTKVVIPILALHNDERYYPKPNVFDPERFSPENIKNIVRYSYLPFGGGKRMCVGMRLAMMEMKTCLAWLLRRYTLKGQPDVRIHFDPGCFVLHDINATYEFIPRPET